LIRRSCKPHTYNPSSGKAEAGGSEFEASLGYTVKPRVREWDGGTKYETFGKKKLKISKVT
jgi:hypothetical protein